MLLQYGLKFPRVNISLERNLKLCILGLVNGAIQSKGLAALDVSLCGVEMRVARNNGAGCHKVTEQYILGSTSLMSGDYVRETCESLNCILQLEER